MTIDEKRFESVERVVEQHDKRLIMIEKEQAAISGTVKTIKEDTNDIKRGLKNATDDIKKDLEDAKNCWKTQIRDLPCSKHSSVLTRIETGLGFKKRLFDIIIGSSGIIGAIIILLKILGDI